MIEEIYSEEIVNGSDKEIKSDDKTKVDNESKNTDEKYDNENTATVIQNKKINLPKNIRQIGGINGGSKRIYIEDYVYTYLLGLAQENTETRKVAVLLGRVYNSNNKVYFFISAAVEAEKYTDENGKIKFGDDCWTAVYTKIKEHFYKLDILGWYISVPGFELKITDEIKDTHLDSFAGIDKVLMMQEPIEKEEAFFAFEKGELNRQSGFYIYYEKNEEMQNYMVKDTTSSEKEFVQDDLVQNFRSILKEKKVDTPPKKMTTFMYSASIVLAMTAVAIAVTMFNNYGKMKTIEDTINYISKAIGSDEQEEVNKTQDVNVNVAADANKEETSTKDSSSSENIDENIKDDMSDNALNETVPQTNDTQSNQTEKNNSQNASSNSSDDSKNNETASSDKVYSTTNTSLEDGYYIVKSGDTLLSISQKLYSSEKMVEEICNLNGIKNYDYIYEGEKILLPTE